MNNNAFIQIKTAENFDDFAALTPIYGQGCNYPTKYGVDGFQVNYTVLANNGIESKEFEIVAQNLDRSDNIMGYNGVEMTSANGYGCDADETGKLLDFLQENDEISYDEAQAMVDVIFEDAKERCKGWYNKNIAGLLLLAEELESERELESECENGDVLVTSHSIKQKILAEFRRYNRVELFDREQVELIIFNECETALKAEIKGDDVDYEFSVSDNPYGYENIVDEAMAIVEQAYQNMGETGLSDEELRANLDDDDLVFVNIFERAMQKTKDGRSIGATIPSNEAVYTAFYSELWRLTRNEDTDVNVWHIEQNDLKPLEQRESIKELCYSQVANLTHDIV